MRYFSFFFLGLSLLAHASAVSNDHRALSLPRSRHVKRHGTPRSQARAGPAKGYPAGWNPPRRSFPNANNKANPNPSPSKSREEVQSKRYPSPSNVNLSSPNNVGRAIISVQSDCGDTGATQFVTATSGPNGNEDWLNCGINDDGGWRPPYVQVSDLVTQELSTAITAPGSPFIPCSPFLQLFYTYGQANGIPPILLASIALQESTCNPDTVGGAGEQGLMQLTSDKCNEAPGGNCKDLDYNIRTGAKFFSDTVASQGGNALEAIGMYNGWTRGMTYTHDLFTHPAFFANQATAAASTGCCRCQNNLDYLQQYTNGWLQNVNAYGNNPRIGKYFNLDQCGN